MIIIIIIIILAHGYLEENPSTQELSENATDAPHVDGSGVMLGAHKDLRSSVILCHDLLGHVTRFIGLFNPEK